MSLYQAIPQNNRFFFWLQILPIFYLESSIIEECKVSLCTSCTQNLLRQTLCYNKSHIQTFFTSYLSVLFLFKVWFFIYYVKILNNFKYFWHFTAFYNFCLRNFFNCFNMCIYSVSKSIKPGYLSYFINVQFLLYNLYIIL